MTITTVLVAYASLVATLALAVSLLLLRSLPGQSLSGQSLPGQSRPSPARTVVSLPPSGPEPGSVAPPIRARTSTGALDTSELTGGHLVAFLSSSCQGCRTGLPFLVDYAVQVGDPQRLIAVIVGERNEGADLERRLAGLARIVSEPEAGPIAAAYRVIGFPSYVLVAGNGTVLATGHSVLDLPQPQPR